MPTFKLFKGGNKHKSYYNQIFNNKIKLVKICKINNNYNKILNKEQTKRISYLASKEI